MSTESGKLFPSVTIYEKVEKIDEPIKLDSDKIFYSNKDANYNEHSENNSYFSYDNKLMNTSIIFGKSDEST